MFSSLLDQEGDRGRATKAHQAAPPSPDAKIRPGSAAGVNRIPLIEASGAPRGAPPPPSSILLSLWRESGPGRRFPFLPILAFSRSRWDWGPLTSARQRFTGRSRFISGASKAYINRIRLFFFKSAELAPRNPDGLPIPSQFRQRSSPRRHPEDDRGRATKAHQAVTLLLPTLKIDPRCSPRTGIERSTAAGPRRPIRQSPLPLPTLR